MGESNIDVKLSILQKVRSKFDIHRYDFLSLEPCLEPLKLARLGYSCVPSAQIAGEILGSKNQTYKS